MRNLNVRYNSKTYTQGPVAQLREAMDKDVCTKVDTPYKVYLLLASRVRVHTINRVTFFYDGNQVRGLHPILWSKQ